MIYRKVLKLMNFNPLIFRLWPLSGLPLDGLRLFIQWVRYPCQHLRRRLRVFLVHSFKLTKYYLIVAIAYNSLCLLRNFQTFSESNNESIMVVGGLVGTKFSTFSY